MTRQALPRLARQTPGVVFTLGIQTTNIMRTLTMATPAAEKALKEMYEKEKILRPDDVIEAARPTNSPLHEYFEWDDSKAAHEHRREQARALIRTVEIRYTINKVELTAPCYVHSPQTMPGKQGYVKLESVKHDSPSAEALVAQEARVAHAAMLRAQSIGAVLGIDAEITRAIEVTRAVEQKATDMQRKRKAESAAAN